MVKGVKAICLCIDLFNKEVYATKRSYVLKLLCQCNSDITNSHLIDLQHI